MNSINYRPEIDGLRSLAVLPVILFHAGFSVFSGGYVGVDVFFVISGYLITSILLRELAEDRFSIARFYERRARRILPALFFVMLVCMPFAWAWMSAPQYADFAQSVVAVLLFVSNILFWQQADYFDTAAEEKPLLHTWSLAIEEQYYIVFPVLLFILWRRLGFRGTLITIGVIALASLAAAELIARERAVANFYLLPTRAWELLAGALCAFAHHRGVAKPNNLLALLGLVLIAASIFLFDETTPFPSLLALLPVGGSALVILYASKGGIAGKLLANPLAVGIGLVSYSAYLWHQPLFAFARIRFDVPDAGVVLVALSIASLLLAWFSWRFVERPFRKDYPLKPFIWLFGGIAAVMASVGLFGAWEYSQGRSRFAEVVYSPALVDSVAERRESWEAVLDNPTFEERLATFADGQSVRILVIGDSHAKDVFNALWFGAGAGEVGADLQIRHANMGGRCTDRIGAFMNGTSADRCFAQLLEQAGPLLEQADAVILTKRWVLEETWNEYLPVYVQGLQGMGIAVAIGGNTVEYSPEVPEMLRSLWRRGTLNPQEAASALAHARRPQVEDTNGRLRLLAERLGVPFLDKAPLLCAASGDECRALTTDGEAIYSDYGHWTLEGAEEIGAKIDEQRWLGPLTSTIRTGQGARQ